MRVAILSALMLSFRLVQAELPPEERKIVERTLKHYAVERELAWYGEFTTAEGSLLDSQSHDLVALFTVEGPGVNYSQVAYVFSRTKSSLKPCCHLVVGGKGSALIDSMHIQNQTLILAGKNYGPSDAMCCPSIPTSWSLVCQSDRLTFIQKPAQ
jgi:hypothetical protein